jgi:uncharacterized cupin superfamily protein
LDEDVGGNRIADGFGLVPIEAFGAPDDEFETLVCKCSGGVSCMDVDGFEYAEILTGGCRFDRGDELSKPV